LIDHRQALEFEEISCILDTHPVLVQMVQADIVQRGIDPGNGRPGMTAEQTLRCLLLKQTTGFSYEDLEFHLADSATYRRFCRIGAFDKSPKRSCLQKNIKRVRAETAEQINRVIIHFAQAEGIETGRLTRVDCTVVETDIHEPGDSWQLWDSVRVLRPSLSNAPLFFGKQPNPLVHDGRGSEVAGIPRYFHPL